MYPPSKIALFECEVVSKLCKRLFRSVFLNLRYPMRIQMTKGLVLIAKTSATESELETLFPAGEYAVDFTSEGKIEIVNTKKARAPFSFSQFREKVSQGDFVVVES